jgi:hypothetical protein
MMTMSSLCLLRINTVRGEDLQRQRLISPHPLLRDREFQLPIILGGR